MAIAAPNPRGSPRRRLRPWGVAVLALLVAGGVALWALGRGAPPQRAAARAPLTVGLSTHLLWDGVSAADIGRELDLAKAAGVDTVRVDFSWSSLQVQARGRYESAYVARADAFFAAVRRRGMRVIAVLVSTPCWAAAAPVRLRQGCAGAWWQRGVERYPPRDPRDFATVAAWVARRYGQSLAALELWNEPDLPRFLAGPDPAREYARLVRAAYPAVKRARPGVPVLAGALSGADGDFLDSLYRDGIAHDYDGLSYHPYNETGDPRSAGPPAARRWSLQHGSEWIAAIARARGDRHPALWITEFGYPTCAGATGCVSERVQAGYTAEAVRVTARLAPVRALVFYGLRDTGANAADGEQRYGLVHRNFSPKPAYTALKQALGR